jgi:glycosyltransferase involved in cell wall biosynthesis
MDGRGGSEARSPHPADISLVLPAYNAAPYVAVNARRVLDHFVAQGVNGELVVADDGSTDGTADAVPAEPNVRVLRLPHRGKGGALRAGMAAATGTIRAFTDADLPYGLEPLDAAVEAIRAGRADAVIGDRTLPGSAYRSSPVRRLLSAAAGLAFRALSGGSLRDTQCGFKAFRGDVAGTVFSLAHTDGFAIDIEVLFLLGRYGFRVEPIPVRLQGEARSSVHPIRDAAAAARDVTAVRIGWIRGRYRSPALAALVVPAEGARG